MISLLDVVFGSLALLFAVRGLFRGLLKEVLSTLGVVGAWWLAAEHGPALAPHLRQWVESPGVAEFAAYVLVFFAVMLGVKVLTWLIAKILKASPVGWIDMPGGLLVGLGKAWLLCCVILAGLLAFLPDAEFVRNSRTAPYLAPGAEYLREKIHTGMDGFDPMRMLPQSLPAPARETQDGGQDDPGAPASAMTEKARALLETLGKAITNQEEKPAQ
ncbi:CvpA family protein [Desulfocurvus sp.]|jgi:membrane protein required for colicin V production|uniref:CvpA family protein n=1 Tax=Desulfocurvus sp. TaxID=2871698 RepID=UPI0025BF33CB|nr:CvpA family protein [Desulfocurvus sp.]MCK9239523.1 CvpA family protein [Desulfocurvus sp.]